MVRAKLQLDPREERQQPSGPGRPPQTSMEDPGGSTSTGARPESKALAGMPGRQLSAERCVRGRGREAAGGWGAAERSGSQLLLDRGRQAQGVSPTPPGESSPSSSTGRKPQASEHRVNIQQGRRARRVFLEAGNPRRG